jgi:hypothetical protein
MAWTNPKTWADGEIPDEDIMNTHVRDNLNALSTHTHSGSAGDGSANLAGVDSITTDDAGSTPSAPGSNKVIIFSEGGVLKMRAGASGSALTFSTTDHTHTVAESTQTKTSSMASTGVSTSYAGGSAQQSVTFTPTSSTGSEKFAILHYASVIYTNANNQSGTFYMNFEKDGTQARELSVSFSGNATVQLAGDFLHVALASSSTVFENDYRATETGNVNYRVTVTREIRTT